MSTLGKGGVERGLMRDGAERVWVVWVRWGQLERKLELELRLRLFIHYGLLDKCWLKQPVTGDLYSWSFVWFKEGGREGGRLLFCFLKFAALWTSRLTNQNNLIIRHIYLWRHHVAYVLFLFCTPSWGLLGAKYFTQTDVDETYNCGSDDTVFLLLKQSQQNSENKLTVPSSKEVEVDTIYISIIALSLCLDLSFKRNWNPHNLYF